VSGDEAIEGPLADQRRGRVGRGVPRNELLERVRQGDTYLLVLAMLVVTYFMVALLPETTWGRLLKVVGVGVTLLLTLRTSHARRGLQQVARAGVLVGLALTIVGSQVEGAVALVGVTTLCLLVVTPFVILNRIVRHTRVTSETVAGAADVYILLGMTFSALYRAIAVIAGNPFFVQTHHATVNQFLYFSYVTETTLGYGDLTPAANLGRSLVTAEAVLGQLFLVTIVARLVSIRASSARSDNAP
jgi:Ion channel